MRSSALSTRTSFAICVSLSVFLSSVPVLSQANAGRIFGSISDPSNALIPGAMVTITDVDRGTSRVIVSDEAGTTLHHQLVHATPGVECLTRDLRAPLVADDRHECRDDPHRMLDEPAHALRIRRDAVDAPLAQHDARVGE